MVFESVVVDVLNRFLGDYVENLDSKQLQIGIWGGDVVLHDLTLKSSALAELDLPVQVYYGRLEKLVLKIPWKNLYGSAVEATVEGLYLLVLPTQEIVYDPAKEDKKILEAKKAELQRIEESKRKQKEKDKPKQDDTFVEKLVTQIIKNVQLKIKNIHVRYEDKMTNIASPFSLGITLSNLSLESTDKSWRPAINTDQESKIYKIVDLEAPAVYWNCNSVTYSSLPVEAIFKHLSSEIATKSGQPKNYHYILGPINSAARLRMNPKPEQDSPKFSIPKIHLNVEMEKLSVAVSKCQYRDIIALAEGFDRMVKAVPFRKYRPKVIGYRGYYKDWWKFAYQCVLEENVRRRRRNWDWMFISAHRDTCKKYGELYQQKLQNRKLPKDAERALTECEEKLDVFNIVLIRQRIELEMERLGKLQESAQKKSWLSSWWGGTSAADKDLSNTTDIMTKFEEAMTADEKARLYQAIDYQENSSPTEYPKDFIDTTCTFVLRMLQVELIDGEEKALISELNSVKCRLDTRLAASAIKVAVNIESLMTLGLKQEGYVPKIIQTETKKVSSGALLDIEFETNPLDEKCGQRLVMNVAPIRVIYDGQTIIRITEIFKIPSSTKLDQLSSAAETGISNIKEMSASGLQHAIEQHSFLVLNIEIHGPIVILPHKGKYTGTESALILNLGRLNMSTEPRTLSPKQVRHMHKAGANKDEVLAEMISQSYDNYNLALTELQVVLMETGQEWQKYMKQTESTSSHMLNPLTFRVKLQKCMITDDPRLPLVKITAELPSIHVNLSDARLVLLLGLVFSVPFPQNDVSTSEPLKSTRSRGSSMVMLMFQEHQENARMVKGTKDLLAKQKEEKVVQFTTVELKFIMSELRVTLNHQDDLRSPTIEIVRAKLSSLESDLILQTFNMNIAVRLASINVTQMHNNAILDIVSTPVTDVRNPYLFCVDFIQVNKKSPEFHSKYGSCESTLLLKFDSLSVVLHQEGLQTLIKYGTDIQTELAVIQKSLDRVATTVSHTQSFPLKRLTSQISEKKSSDYFAKKRPKKSVVVETIIFKVKGSLNTLTVELANEHTKVASCAVKGIESEVIIKKPYTQINAKLLDLSILDLNPQTYHKKILTVSDKFALSAQIVMYNLTHEAHAADTNVDTSIEIAMGRMKIVFLNWFLCNILSFVSNFQAAQETIMEASSAAATSAKQNMQYVYNKATKVSVKVDLKAPDIIVPANSKSRDALLLDMGNLTVKNRFVTLEQQKSDVYQAVVDEMKLKLTDFKLLRVFLDEDDNVMNECVILEPVTFVVRVERNLSNSWYRAIPDLDISGQIDTINLELSKGDYDMVISILNDNLKEGQTPTMKQVVSKPIVSTQSSEMLGSAARSFTTEVLLEDTTSMSYKEDSAVYIFVKFTFTMNAFTLQLHEGGSTHSVLSPTHHSRSSLGKFSVSGLSVKGRMMSDNALIVSLILVDCELDDTRKGREGMLTRMIERSCHLTTLAKQKSDIFATSRSMIDITFQQTPTDMFVDVRIFSFTLILSVDYLMQLAEFFKTEAHLPQIETATMKAKASSAQLQKSTAAVESKAMQMKINIKIEKPDIILVEQMNDVDTNAMILNCEVVVNCRVADAHQVVSGTVKDFQLYTCCYNPKRRQETRAEVLHPLTISIAGSTPEQQGLHLEVVFSAVRIRVSPDTIELLNNVLVTMSGRTRASVEGASGVHKVESTSIIWNFKEFQENDYWFLKIEEADEAFEVLPTSEELMEREKLMRRELCIVTVPVLVVTMEVGLGSKTLPMLLLESSFSGNVNNWSSQMSVDASLTLQMGYYNSNLALWEPLIEPIAVVKNNKTIYTPWELRFELTRTEPERNDMMSPTDSEQEIQVQPATCINISSVYNMEVTISRHCVLVLKNLGKAFSEAMKHDQAMRDVSKLAPYTVKNHLGTPVKLCLAKSSFCIHETEDTDNLEVILQHGAEAPLDLKDADSSDTSLKLGREATLQEERILHIKIDQVYCELNLPVTKADTRFFPLNYRLNTKESWGIISDISAENGVLTITLRSTLQVHNHFKIPIDVYYMTVRGNELECIASVAPGKTLDLPLMAVYSPTSEVFVSVAGYSVSTVPYVWKDLQQNLSVTKVLQCNPTGDAHVGEPPFVIKAVGDIEQVFYENTLRHTMGSTCYNIHLQPAVTIKNCLPIDIICCGQSSIEETKVNPGESLQLPHVEPGSSYVVIRLPNYLEKEWSCRKDIVTNPPGFSVWEFDSHDGLSKVTLHLGMHVLIKNESMVMALYCPFWMLNKTDLLLSYRSDENLNVLHHPADFKGPILFSFNTKNFFGKKKAAVRVDQGQWSDKFSLDVAGSSGVIVCKGVNMIYQIGVQNQLTYNGFTKQVTFTPYYVIINDAPFAIECQELERPADPWVVIEPKSCTALWPKSERDDKLLKLRVVGSDEVSAPFLFTESHTTLLRLNNRFAGINVDIQLTEGAVYINLTAYEVGMAPALIMNHTKQTMHFWEKETVQIRKLPPYHSFLYTWENPSGPRILVWEIGHKKEIEDDLRKDGVGEFSPMKDTIVYWVSFLDGMQRVLLFTTDKNIAEGAQSAKQFEEVVQEVNVSMHGLGISLVRSEKRQEIMYIGIASSGVIWESCKLKSKRFKQMKARDVEMFEAAYQVYLTKSQLSTEDIGRALIDKQTEVDFTEGLILKPHKRKIRRTFLTGLWLQMKSGPSQLQLHAKVNRLQIDNQMLECIFPVVLAPVPPPRSVAADFVYKPFVEISIVQLLIKHSQIKQFKYFKILVQEFHVKVDLGFINAAVEMLQTGEFTETEELQQFRTDMQLVDEQLYSHVSTQSLQEQKSFYDVLHFSPLKIHISFSLASTGTAQGFATPNFLTVLLQGLGVTLTDMQDVVFKLAYFQREYSFLTQRQLISETMSHYMGQLVKQLYVLVLGLDVLGNPYGLVLGITKGVEDLFYEPFQGAIQGPGEFAEGVMLGVRSLFGHTVGGAAGAVSRITGAMGKGIAVLTFDEEYQRKRRDQINKKPATVQEGIARGGKGLVMGVLDGVTGVFTKPISGAKEQGVEGFFTGLGKGAVGLFARPTAGVIDFASGSLDAVKRVTELGEEVNRLRPPRFFHADCYIRPYNHLEADGNKLLNDLEKGKYATTDVYSTHFFIVGKKEVLLLTDKRIAYITHNDIFGNWQTDWSYTWTELPQHPVRVVAKGVCVLASENKKKKLGLFGSNDSGKLIIVGSQELREEIAQTIEQHRACV